jgi:hypothetical protein
MTTDSARFELTTDGPGVVDDDRQWQPRPLRYDT